MERDSRGCGPDARSEQNISGGSETGVSKEKRGRTKAENRALKEFVDRAGKPKIIIQPGKRRVLGTWGNKWITEIGIICRKTIPYSCLYWKDVSYEQKVMLYKKVQMRFDVDITQWDVQETIDSSVKGRLRDRRHTLHKHYLDIPDGEDKMDYPYDGVCQEDWEKFCKHFESEDFQKMSNTNKKNRENNKINHRGGRKSFVQHRYDQIDPETGKEPDFATFYRNMRWNNKKGWISPEAEENYDKMVDIRSRPIEEGEQQLTDVQIGEKVLGTRSGYVRGLGHGEVPPTSKARIAVNEDEVNQLRLRAEDQEKRAEEQERRAEEQERRVAEQEREINELRALQEESHRKQEESNRKQLQMEEMLNAIKQKFGL